MISLFELSFYFAYLFLAGSTPLTAFEVFNQFPDKYEPLKYILAIETTVNIIAGFAYSQLITLINKPDFSGITGYRYLDWFATTPLLLISFTLYLQYRKNIANNNNISKNNNKIETGKEKINETVKPVKFDFDKLAIILLLNAMMLIMGFLGETNRMDRYIACIIGFIPFIAMFYYIWKWYGDLENNKNIFLIFIFIWGLYGIVYLLPNTPKNVSYNILDVIAKVGFGLLIWFEVVQLRLISPDNSLEPNHS